MEGFRRAGHKCDQVCKTDHVRTKIEIRFLAQLIAVLNSYPYTMSAMARLKLSAFLRGKFTAL